jgi:sporulation protein YlmC with PRC-barrel domain
MGLDVECSDGVCGTVGDVVVSPRRRVVTHLVVEPDGNHDLARLVPIDAFDPGASATAVSLRCRRAELWRYPVVEESAYVTLGEWPVLRDAEWEVGVFKVLALPFDETFGLYESARAVPGSEGAYMAYDRIPAGDVELRRRSTVEASDGRTIGHVDGVIVGDDGRITHLVLERGHLWGRRDVTIPVAAVKQLRTDEVELGLTAEEVADLPSVPVHRHGGPGGG